MNEKTTFILFDKDTDFQGEIKTSHLILEGKVDGVIHADKEIHLRHGACIKGEIYTSNFHADRGTVCDGKLHIENMNNAQESRIEKAENLNGQVAQAGQNHASGNNLTKGMFSRFTSYLSSFFGRVEVKI